MRPCGVVVCEKKRQLREKVSPNEACIRIDSVDNINNLVVTQKKVNKQKKDIKIYQHVHTKHINAQQS